MKPSLLCLALAGVLLLAGVPASAATITIVSTGNDIATQYNNSPIFILPPNANNKTIPVATYPGWAAPFAGSTWVSFNKTGLPLDYIVPSGIFVTFTHEFLLPAGPAGVSGELNVMADDSTSVFLNGVLLYAEASPTGNTYATCSDRPIGCLATTAAHIALPASAFHLGGVNKLVFQVSQRNAVAFGLNYGGTIVTTAEPASGWFVGAGAVLLILRRLRSRR